MKVLAYRTFRDRYRLLPASIRKKVDRQMVRLAENPRHPSLNAKRIQGTTNIWEARVGLAYRMTFEVAGDTIFLRVVGRHDDALSRP